MTSSLDKDDSILNLLERLRSDLGDDAFDVVDHWDGDLVSIGLALPSDHQVLAYISTLNAKPDTYSYELELPPTNDDAIYSVASTSDSCSYAELLQTLCAHWKITR